MNYLSEIFNLTFRPIGLLSFIPFLLNILLIIYAVRRLPKHPVTIAFYFFLISSCLGQLQDSMTAFSVTALTANFWLNFLGVGVWFTPIGLHFALLYVRHPLGKNIGFLTALYGISFFINTARTTMLIRNDWDKMIFTHFGWSTNVPSSNPYFTLYASWVFLGLFIIVGVLLWYALTVQKKKNERNATFLIVGGLLLPIVQTLITQILFPILHLEQLPLTSMFIFFFSLAVFIAMTRYQFLAITPSIVATTIISTMGEMLFVVNEIGEIVLTNKASSQTLQVPEDALKGVHLRKYIPLIDELLRLTHNAPPNTTVLLSHEGTTIFAPNQAQIPVSLSVAIVRDSGGKMIGLTIVCYSLDQQKKYIEELGEQNEIIQKAKAELEEKVIELERFQKMTIDRELQMVELKKENTKLKERLEQH